MSVRLPEALIWVNTNYNAVSENKPVGSTQIKDVCYFHHLVAYFQLIVFEQGDLIGDEVTTPAIAQPVISKSNKDLLLEIFGDSSTSNGPVSARPPQPSQKNAVDDIMSLFGSSSIVPASAPAAAPPPSYVSTPPAPSAFSMPQSQLQPQSPALSSVPPAAPPRMTAYTAYEKNELKVTLTPQTSPAKPGVVIILARFQAMGGNEVAALNFQAAVPKVCSNTRYIHHN